MKKLISLSLAVVMALSLLTACGGGSKPAEESKAPEKTPEELAQIYTDAINNCGSEMVQYNPVIAGTKADDESAMLLELLGLTSEDLTAFGVSISMMNVKAYAIALIRPAEGKEEAVKEGLQGFIDLQKSNFERYLEDQYEIAKAARLETLSDGSVLLVMTENQDAAFDSIRDAVEKA